MNPYAEPTSAEMAQEVENERAGLVNTLDQLRENLRPENVVDEMFSQANVGSSDFMDKVWGLARANPIPAALIGIGAAMLAGAGQRFKARPRAHDPRWDGFEEDLADPSIFDASTGDLNTAPSPYLPIDYRTDPAMNNSYSRPRTGLSRIIDEQPLVLAALGLAVGAAVGSAIPSTDLESQWMGDASESMRQNANALAREQISNLRSTANQTISDMKATAAQHGVSSDNLSGLVHDLGETAKKSATNYGQTT